MQLSCLRLSYFQNLSQESGGAVDVAVHHEIVFLILWCHRLEFVDGGRDDGKRGEQLVGDIGKDNAHLQAVFGLHPFLVPACRSKDAANEHQDIEHEGYSGSIPWRQNLDGDGVWQFLPLAVAVCSFYPQVIGSGRKILEDCLMDTFGAVLPVFVITFQLVGIYVFLCIAVGKKRKFYGEFLHPCRYRDFAGIGRHFFRNLFLVDGVELGERLVINDDVCYHQFRSSITF